MSFRIVVIGYSEMMASVINGAIDSGCSVVGVLRNERTKYHPFFLKIKDIFNPSTEYSYIKNKKLYEIKANSVNSKEFKKEFLKLNADIIIVASWSERLKKETIILPQIACINTHPSLLPKYRGPNPYIEVIRNQEKETGVTFHLMDENYDTGPILAQAKVPILPNDTGKILKARCCIAARMLLKDLLIEMYNNIINPTKQDEANASYYPQITSKDILVDFTKTSVQIDAQLRAISDWQSCYFKHKKVFYKIKKYKLLEQKIENVIPGTIVLNKKNTLNVVCGDGKIISFEKPKLYSNFSGLKTFLYSNFILKEGDILC